MVQDGVPCEFQPMSDSWCTVGGSASGSASRQVFSPITSQRSLVIGSHSLTLRVPRNSGDHDYFVCDKTRKWFEYSREFCNMRLMMILQRSLSESLYSIVGTSDAAEFRKAM